MKFFKLLTILIVLAFTACLSNAQDTLYYEFFTDGTINLDWFTPWEGGDEMEVDYMPGNPSGDNWVGFVENGSSGGGVGSVLAGQSTLTDYEIRANLYTTVNTGTYHSILARWDTTGGLNSYYYLRTDFDADQRIQLRKYPGSSGFGETIREWIGGEIPGGVPTEDSWHEMALNLEADQLWAYYDGILLSGSPFTDDYLSSGFFGIYCFNFMSTINTTCDDIVVLGDPGAVPFDFIAEENHYLDENLQEMTLRPAEGQIIHFSLDWSAFNGENTTPSFFNILEIDDVMIFRENNPGVDPNTFHTTTSDSWTAELGEHVLRWTLDASAVIPELFENNNILEDTFLVLPPTAFDFQADSAWITDEDTVMYQNSPEIGDEVLFVLSWSVPMGEGTSGVFSITMNLDGSPFYQELVPNTVSGINNLTVTPAWTASEGFHYFQWELDPDNWVDEFNENNNFTLNGFEVWPTIPSFEYNLAQYWNLISLPVIPEDSSLSALFPNATVAYEFTGGTYEQTFELVNGKAYWIYVSEAETVTVEGMPFTQYSVPVDPPWEMLGSVSTPSIPTVDPGNIVVMYNFDQTYNQIEDLVMEPGFGYWVNLTGDVEEFSLNGEMFPDGLAKNEVAEADKKAASVDDWELTFALNGDANAFNLTIGNSETAGNIPAPPAPPQYSVWGELYETDWSAGPYFSMIQPSEADMSIWLTTIDPDGNANPQTFGTALLSWDAESIPAQGLLSLVNSNGEVVIEDMRAVESLEINGSEAFHYEIVFNTTLGIGSREDAIPADYTLYQNAPNPFNPVTQIKYYLLETGKVKVTVFNIMGEEVAVLADGVQNQGFHVVNFEATNLTSGIYFYRIEAGDFTDIKKMVFIK